MEALPIPVVTLPSDLSFCISTLVRPCEECEMYVYLTLTIPLLAFVPAIEPARFLAFFPITSKSHHFIYRPVLEELAKNGHDIVYVTPFPFNKPPKGIMQIVLRTYNYEMGLDFDFIASGERSIIGYLMEVAKLHSQTVKSTLKTKEVQDLIHSEERFDAVLFEPYFGQEYMLALVHKFNAIGIDVVTMGDFPWTNELAGLPDNPAYQLSYISQVPENMDFWQRLYNTFVTTVITLRSYYILYQGQLIMNQYFNYTGWETRPPIEALARNKSLILVNFNHLLGHPYPAPPHRKDIGGINIKPNKPLPKELQTFMDESKGVIYMSFGTHVNSTKIVKELGYFFRVFGELPQRALVKFDGDYTGDVPPNIKTAKWFPQQDILAHNSCVLFITHGGLLSISEAIYYGVPLIGIPIFADQPKNVIFAESAGYGRLLRFRNITKETVSRTVREILSNKRYKEEAVRRSKMFRDRRHTPAEEAVYWIEYSLKYPYSLTPKAASLTAIQLHLVDIKLFAASVLLSILCTIYIITRTIIGMFSNQTGNKKIKLQ